jgi:hypothetical protein
VRQQFVDHRTEATDKHREVPLAVEKVERCTGMLLTSHPAW